MVDNFAEQARTKNRTICRCAFLVLSGKDSSSQHALPLKIMSFITSDFAVPYLFMSERSIFDQEINFNFYSSVG